MDLIDEQDDFSGAVNNFLDNSFQTLLELTLVLRNLGKNSNDLLFVLFSIISFLFSLGTLPLAARAGSRDGN